jgi:Rieske Fe-S protein
MSHEDQPGNDQFGNYQNEEAGTPTPPLTVKNGDYSTPVLLPGATTQPDAPTEILHPSAAFPATEEGYSDTILGVDPFAWWAATSGRPLTSSQTHVSSTMLQSKSDSPSRPQPERQNRRKFVKLLVVGAAGLATAVTIGGVSFARTFQRMTQSPSLIEDDRSDGPTSIDAHRERDDEDWGRKGRRQHKTLTHSQSPTPSPKQTQTPQPSQTQTPQPTQIPKPTMTTTPTGTVIGSTSQATNSAVSFTNPADNQGSFLIHLGNGNWVACERACTHQGAWVNYDPTTGRLVCPAHGAIFDPANACSVLQGPAATPLPTVSIHVNANGTITTP